MSSTNENDMDSAMRLMEIALKSYYHLREREGDTAETDCRRMQFAGEKFMLEALLGPKAKAEALVRLRQKGLKIPHCGDRQPDGSYLGWDSDADPDF